MYEGQLPAIVTILATVPGGKNWIIKHISVVNTDGSDRTFALYRNGITDPFLFTPSAAQVVAGGAYEFTGTLALEAGGTIAGIASVGSKLTTIIDGDEVTL